MKKNITISIEEPLAREAKILAAQNDTSVSQLLAGYLRSILKSEGKRLSAKRHFFKLTQKKRVINYGQRDFQRASLHER